MICSTIIKLFFKQPRIFNDLNKIHDDNNDYYNSDTTASTYKTKSILGLDEYDAKPPICCRLLKRLGFCYMINRYFRRNAKRIHDIRSKLEIDY